MQSVSKKSGERIEWCGEVASTVCDMKTEDWPEPEAVFGKIPAAKGGPANVGKKVTNWQAAFHRKHPELNELRKAIIAMRRGVEEANAVEHADDLIFEHGEMVAAVEGLSPKVKRLQNAFINVLARLEPSLEKARVAVRPRPNAK